MLDFLLTFCFYYRIILVEIDVISPVVHGAKLPSPLLALLNRFISKSALNLNLQNRPGAKR